MRIGKRWIIILALLVVAAIGAYLFAKNRLGSYKTTTTVSAQGVAVTDQTSTTQIMPATAVIGQVSASGNIALSNKQYVVLKVSGVVAGINASVGDQVKAGDLLLSLDTTELERTVRRDELSVQAAVNKVKETQAGKTVAEVAAAKASLSSALENLAAVQAGASQEEIAAARSQLASAQASYNDLLAGASQAKLTQLVADVKKADIALHAAQSAYDQVKWRNDVGMTSQASDLQQATVDYESAQAAYAEATAPAGQADLATALSNIQTAQQTLNDLLQKPTAADLTSAQAQVAEAQATLDAALNGDTETAQRDAQISLDQALVDLQEAYTNLANAKLVAPISGSVLEIDLEPGQQGSSGATAVVLADTTRLELTVNVAEADISQVEEGQAADIEIDALPGQTLKGRVSHIAPSSDSSSDLVNYAVTVQLAADQVLDKVRPGMTAVATIANTNTNLTNGWLVPTDAIQQQNGASFVTVVRNGTGTQVEVTPGTVQGEWTVVQADELQAGDQVVGSLVSQIDQQQQQRFGPPSGGPGR